MQLWRRKWAEPILAALARRALRYTDLRDAISATAGEIVSNKMLTETMRYLQDHRLVSRKPHGTNGATLYAITDEGQGLHNRLRAMQAAASRSTPSRSSKSRDTVGDTIDWQPPPKINMNVPSTARMYDYFLGGKDNYAVDREAADAIIAVHPEQRELAQQNRGFLVRAVQVLARAGIDQFIDLGTGIPTSPNVHEVAREIQPDARVVYVDHDAIVTAHNHALRDTEGVVSIEADMRRPSEILTHPEVVHVLDFERPIAVLLVAVLHFVGDDEDPAGIVRAFHDAMAPGSYIALSTGSTEGLSDEEVAKIATIYQHTPSGCTLRSRNQIESLFAGFEVLEPGLVHVARWRSDGTETRGKILAAVGRKPAH